jgi:quaternary ammonium compound-resistance protein SugE
MKESNGFMHIPWTLATIILLLTSVFLLNKGLKRGIPIGGGYAVWVGIGAVGSFIAGILIFEESIVPLRLLAATVIIIGIVGVEYYSDSELKKKESLN